MFRLRSLARAGVVLLLGAAMAAAGPNPRTAAAAGLPAAGRLPAHVVVEDPAGYVDPYVGTRADAPDRGHGGGAGNTFPGASAPFGMMQWSPDTATYQHGGYAYDDPRLSGLSLTHISGAGCSDYGTTPFMPVLDGTPTASSAFSHANERLAPGSYGVTLDNGIGIDLAVTQRSGIARFSYPAGHTASLAVDAGRAFNAASGELTVEGSTISGFTDGGGFCGTSNRYRVYFHAAFDHPFSHVDAGDRSPDARTVVSFDTGPDDVVTARVGISFVSVEGARANLESEQRGAPLAEVRARSRARWNDLLGRIAVAGGTSDQRRVFYTALYHALLHPSVFSDTDGRYPGFDGRLRATHRGHAQYADFSGWDVYRSQIQLIALIAPDEAADIAQSITDQGDSAGYFDRWTLANGGTGVMVGDPLPTMAATVHAFGATGFDAARLLRLARQGRDDPRQRPGHEAYDTTGFVPADTEGQGASITLEYATTDFALAQLAARLGDSAARDVLLRRSANWRNVFNDTSRYVQPRDADGSWPPFSPERPGGFAEGNSAQYTWMVPHDQRGLFDAMGGRAAAVNRLDTFFTELNAGSRAPYAYLGNEPSLNTPWAYAYAGRPDRAQDVVRRALTTLFTDTPGGEPGNDDLGQMSSWAVWAALGMYPQVPGRAELVLASPRFPAVTIRRGDGPTIDISAPGASDTVRYVHALRTDGRPTGRPWVSEHFVRHGGTLAFTLSDTPDPSWGSDPADAPPSFPPPPAPAQVQAPAQAPAPAPDQAQTPARDHQPGGAR
ncbi:GH92 family glycosyl hydrolase [Kitasatospora sp. NPDC101447]|uniref:GH92 family glycosyl hydrolase n=1 Tax=Kitasatospora sp. NPDC101447 TaxID=3364102 RepID=UPI003828F671